MSGLEKRNPPCRAGSEGANACGGMHADHASADVLLQRLDGVQKSGNGWRARCPACGGTSRKLTVAEADDRVLVHCFGCGDPNAILAAVGLSWADLHPPRDWPPSLDERRRARRAIKEAGFATALETLAMEWKVVQLAQRQVSRWQPLCVEDDARLALAGERIDAACNVFSERQPWRPNA